MIFDCQSWLMLLMLHKVWSPFFKISHKFICSLINDAKSALKSNFHRLSTFHPGLIDVQRQIVDMVAG